MVVNQLPEILFGWVPTIEYCFVLGNYNPTYIPLRLDYTRELRMDFEWDPSLAVEWDPSLESL